MSKFEKLKKILREMRSVLIAYSGGVDSTFLLKAAMLSLPRDKILAVTAKSETYSKGEFRDARRFAKLMNARHRAISTSELGIKNFSKNPINRCFYCKDELFSKLKALAKRKGLNYVLDGTNKDDDSDYRPGRKAALALGVRSPLKEAGFTKEDIRGCSKKLKLPSWNKPQMACLASRFPYGEVISERKLSQVEKAEDYLERLGFDGCRVRYHDGIARIELMNGKISKLVDEKIRYKVASQFKKLGFRYVTVDLEGYRQGSMNETIKL